MDVKDLFNRVCGELPDGYSIDIHLEKDSGDAELFDEYGEEIEFPSNRESLVGTILDALSYADQVATERGMRRFPSHNTESGDDLGTKV